MGTDDLHYKRKARQLRSFARRKAQRAPYDKVLIVCEGEKTEPNYFNGLKNYLALSSANVEVTGDSGSSPLSVVKYAIARYHQEGDAGDAYDKVFCVFDKDSHADYGAALDRLVVVKPKGVFVAVTSVPCFEYWLLLHFQYTTAPFYAVGGKSAGALVLEKLRAYMPEYSKGHKLVFDQLVDQLPRAKAHALQARREAVNSGTDNPSTLVHELVEYLEGIKIW